MSKDIHIKKGLDIKLEGEAEKVLKTTVQSEIYTVYPEDFHRVIPKLIAKKGDAVKVGSPLFFAKGNEKLRVPSPVSGQIIDVIRAEKRKIVGIQIKATSEQVYEEYGVKSLNDLKREEIIDHLSLGGCWPFIKQRPYDVIASPKDKPKAIFVSGMNTEPLAPEVNFSLKDQQEELAVGFSVLSHLTDGEVHLTIDGQKKGDLFSEIQNIKVHKASGKHPVGLVSTQINKINPINKGEKVWVVKIEDVAAIGSYWKTGRYQPKRVIALTGAGVKTPVYTEIIKGAKIEDVLKDLIKDDKKYRIIRGNVLTGTKSSLKGAIGHYDNQITLIPEGDDYDFFGWNKPQPNKFSVSRAGLFSFLTPQKKYNLNTNTNGEHRAFVVTGEYEKVFPLDIYPMQLLKAILVNDIDEMESLGIYEVAPEDFALTEYICISKQNHQQIVREGLDLMITEVG